MSATLQPLRYGHAAHQICEEPELSRLAPRLRNKNTGQVDPLTQHENIVYDWLGQGGKRSRPFITLAAYDALQGAPGTYSEQGLVLPDTIRRSALAIGETTAEQLHDAAAASSFASRLRSLPALPKWAAYR